MAVILAAGESVRMGHPKSLLEYAEGETFLRHLAGVFASAGCDVTAVLGHEAARIAAEHAHLATVHNERWLDGQLSSARLGIARALAAGAPLILVHPVDTPAIAAESVATLLLRSTSHCAAVPLYRGKAGHPLVLPHACAQVILRQESARTLEEALRSVDVESVETDDPGVALNLNTPHDYERAFGRPPRLARRREGSAAR